MMRIMRTWESQYLKGNEGQDCRHTNYTQAYPLLPSRSSCFVDSLIQLLVPFIKVYDCIFSLVVDVLNRRLLLDDSGLHVLKQLCEFDHLPLDLLNGFMTSLHSPQCRLRLASPVLG